MIIINVYDNGTGNKVGTSRMDKESYNWNHDIVHSFGFIPDNPKYVYGIFLLENADELEISKEEFVEGFVPQYVKNIILHSLLESALCEETNRRK